MDVVGYVLIVGALVGAGALLIVVFLRQKTEQQNEISGWSSPGSLDRGPGYTPPVDTGLPVQPPPEEVAPTAEDQHTIYAFAREVQVNICPCCDGENNIYRDRCCICGFAFERGGWAR